MHKLQFKSRTAEWVDLESALKGPAYVAKVLIRKLQDDRSNFGRPYRLDAEQLECTALFVAALDTPFAERPDKSKPWLHPAEVLMMILTDGGGGCGKTTLAVEVILPLLEAYFHPESVLRRAPSNKLARLMTHRWQDHALWTRLDSRKLLVRRVFSSQRAGATKTLDHTYRRRRVVH